MPIIVTEAEKRLASPYSLKHDATGILVVTSQTPYAGAPDSFKFQGWKCSLRGWKCFAAITAACILRNISRIGLRSIFFSPQWGAADAEIKVPSGGNTVFKCSPFKAWSRSVYSHTCYAYRQGFLPCLFLPSGPFTRIFSKTSPDFSCFGCG